MQEALPRALSCLGSPESNGPCALTCPVRSRRNRRVLKGHPGHLLRSKVTITPAKLLDFFGGLAGCFHKELFSTGEELRSPDTEFQSD